MAGAIIVVAVALFLAAVVAGVIAVVALAVRREDRWYTLPEDAPNLMSRTARRLTGVRRRGLNAEFFPVNRRVTDERPMVLTGSS
jgi:hypothetical protein